MDNLSPDRSEELMRYLDQQMGVEEKRSFEEAMATDPSLAAEAESLSAAKHALMLYGIAREVAGVHAVERASAAKQAPVVQMPARRRTLRYAIAAAASVLLILFAALLYNKPHDSAGSLYAENFVRFEPGSNRGSASPVSAMEKAYLQKNDQAVIDLYRADSAHEAEQALMAGIAYLETKRADKAIDVLLALQANNAAAHSSFYKDDAEYYLALAYLENKNYTAAALLMEKIYADKENPYSNKFPPSFTDRVKKL